MSHSEGHFCIFSARIGHFGEKLGSRVLIKCSSKLEKLRNLPLQKDFCIFGKEIDRSSLLEDFLRKSEIVDSGDFSIHEENLCTFERCLDPSYDFLPFLIFFSSSCVLSIPYGLHTPKIFVRRHFNVKVRYISNFLLILADFGDF